MQPILLLRHGAMVEGGLQLRKGLLKVSLMFALLGARRSCGGLRDFFSGLMRKYFAYSRGIVGYDFLDRKV